VGWIKTDSGWDSVATLVNTAITLYVAIKSREFVG
jgi:hypothetical protein